MTFPSPVTLALFSYTPRFVTVPVLVHVIVSATARVVLGQVITPSLSSFSAILISASVPVLVIL